MALRFTTKAGTLALLQGRLQTARIAPLVAFTVREWQAGRAVFLEHIPDALGSGPWIVRSSCLREDCAESSNAGAFLSLLNVGIETLGDAVEQVIAAYGEAQPVDEVLVQPMLRNVLRSGVVFSHDPNTCAPYRVVNWTEGADTAAITGGSGGRIWQQAACSPVAPPETVGGAVALVEELLELFGNIPIDCEFAVTRESGHEVLWLLQARPLILRQAPVKDEAQAVRLHRIQEKVVRGMRPHPFLMGRRTVYGVMPDWNPAEIIGIRPKPLALSLYRELVTDAIWAYQRHNYGYRHLRSFPLMPHFFGLPYIDVRVSFNSFVPADLDDGIAGRLVDHYIDQLLAKPALHDKVEFEIVYSCYTLDLPQRLGRLGRAGFSATECRAIEESLRRLTNRIVTPKDGLWRADAAKLDILEKRRGQLLASDVDLVERIYWLLEDAKRYGTLPFAGLARVGFMAVQMLRSMVAVGVLSQDDYDAFIGSVSTVSGQLARDRCVLDRTSFLARYGHLRPGTYDILSPRYDEAPDMYFDWERRLCEPEPPSPFSMTLPQMRKLSGLLETHGLHSDPIGLFDFLQAGIELRELSKFHFTRNLSDALALMARCGEMWGFSREDMAYCDVEAFRELHIAATDPRDVLTRSIERGRARYAETLSLALPPLVTSPEDVWGFEWPETTPNFISQKRVTAPVTTSDHREALAGAVVCIPSADPGFDWLFSYPIAGLITAWGGANSHMAIRAGELGVPAVIGAGEMLYRRWASAHRLHVDCAGRRVEVLA
ncbi:phosphohistidine swiveling domain-containing protein [Desulfobaculum xiamenense]|uniref:Phosphohistidine swiveling domain-containing protein n=1 Tax=Desulfobaculum xiamenense TaxID=995050 RepID=A0A846QKL1_9BACT|nr:PEP-utilizing enzyme [Desulfobaculum xiamenense]NJB66723.1 phosphohistidine swiveling domain-containing protein [Desulfobaculum xiamenense]